MISHSVSGPASSTTYTAAFDTQYQLATVASPVGAGAVTPAAGIYANAGSTVGLQATASAGYSFQSSTGPVANTSNASTTVTLTGPVSVTANFVPGPTGLSGLITAKSGLNSARTSTITLANPGPRSSQCGKHQQHDAFTDIRTCLHSRDHQPDAGRSGKHCSQRFGVGKRNNRFYWLRAREIGLL